MKMTKILLTAGIVCLALAGWISADLISSSISVDGSSWIKSSVTGDRSYAGLMFTTDQSTVTRSVDFSKALDTQTRIMSTGPLGVYEYSKQTNTPRDEFWRCLFARSDTNPEQRDKIETRGILSSGNYTGVRGLTEDLTTAGTDINGNGLMSLSKRSESMNRSQEERSVAAGRMNVSEYVEYGGES